MVRWHTAQYQCANAIAGQRVGWRLPTLSELQSLVDKAHTKPTLPPGHPFVGGVQLQNYFWTQTQVADQPNYYYAVEFDAGRFTPVPNMAGSTNYVWCVRGAAVGGQ